MKRIAYFVVIILSLIAINNLLHSSISLWQKNDVLTRAQKQLEKEKKEHDILVKQLSVVKDSRFVEQEARNKLVLGKPGEQLVLFPTPSMTPAEKKRGENVTDPHLTQWKKLFMF